MLKDLSASAITAGFLAVLIAYTGPMIIVFQAASIAGISNEMIMSWVWAISMGIGLSGILLSVVSKKPIMIGWSVPGTVLLVSLFPVLTLSEMVGAYMIAAIIIMLIGWSGTFDKLMQFIPQGVAGGMMAGLLFSFATAAFSSIESAPFLMICMVLSYLVTKYFWPRYCMLMVFILGLLISYFSGEIHLEELQVNWTQPILTKPEFTLFGTLSLALPLVVVSLAGQYLPGMAILKLDGYHDVQARPIMLVTGFASFIFALFGSVSIVLGAISAAIATGKDCHTNPDKRYIGGISNGVFYILGALFSSAVVTLFAVLPKELVVIVAGLALISSIGSSLVAAIEDTANREASLLTFLATASGMTWLGLASAFWGIIIGMIASFIFNPELRQQLFKTSKANS